MVKLQIIGHLGRDSVLNNVNGKSVINFTVAHSEKYKDSQGVQKDRTLWVDCSYWTDRTGIAPYLKKGTQVYAEGAPDIRTYTTNDGKQGAAIIMRVFSVQLLGGKGEGQGSGESQPANQTSATNILDTNTSDIIEPLDDLPF